MNKETANMLGLCQRAGKLLTGDCQVKNSIKGEKVKLVLIANDASDRTKKDYLLLLKNRKIAYYLIDSKEEMGLATGKSPRAAVAIADENFALKISELIAKGERQITDANLSEVDV